MKVIHLCSDYAKQRLYSSLFKKLQSYGIEQFIYVPIRTKEEFGINDISNLQNTNVKYENILKKHHRIFYNLKIKLLYNKLLLTDRLENANLIHAHFLFSDGGVALKAWYDKKIPYIVSIRNTDINYFFRFMPHLRKKGIEILFHAKAIIFVTPSYKNLLFNKYVSKELRVPFETKTHIIPNGIEEFWFRNKSQTPKQRKDELRVLYVGDFSPNKNIESIIGAVKLIRHQSINVNLTLVGGGGNNSRKTEAFLKKNMSSSVNRVGIIKEENKLIKFYSSHDIFVMPSFQETFGVVYIEAMSQGLPIIYTKGQGIDGYFSTNPPGYAVDPRNIEDIKQHILKAHANLEILSQNGLNHICNFSWDIISKKYAELYEKIGTSIFDRDQTISKVIKTQILS